MRKALAVPTVTDRIVTHTATMTLVQMLPSNAVSWNSPTRPVAALPVNQSSVNPRQGGAGELASLHAHKPTMTRGGKRKTRNAATYSTVAVRSQAARGNDAIMTAS